MMQNFKSFLRTTLLNTNYLKINEQKIQHKVLIGDPVTTKEQNLYDSFYKIPKEILQNNDTFTLKHTTEILRNIPKTSTIFINSLYSRKLSLILTGLGHSTIIDITHEKWRNARMLDRELIRENLTSIESVYAMLSDDYSRQLLRMLLEFRLTMNPIIIQNSPFPQYFHPQIHPTPGESFLDGGAFIGDTILSFMQNLQGDMTAVCFEPDKDNFEILKRCIVTNKMGRNVKAVPLGLWSKPTQLSFDSASQSSRIVTNAENKITVVDIDTYCRKTNFNPTLIKMDVEGAELEALLGAENTIHNNMPKMMISAYHHGSHLWEIPLRLAELGYTKLYLGHHPHEYTIYETIVYADNK